MKNEITTGLLYGAVMKKGANIDRKESLKANAVPSEKKSEYAYADPYQLDKWSLQAIARGQKEESAYASIDDAYPEAVRMADATYAEVNIGGKIKHALFNFWLVSIWVILIVIPI